MLETEWEASRKTHRKRLRIIFYVLIPLSILSGIVFYNNRDLLQDGTITEENVKVSDDKILPEESFDSMKETRGSSGNPPERTLIIEKTVPAVITEDKTVAESRKNSTDSIPFLHSGEKKIESEYSEVLRNITCRINDKKNIEILMSVEVFYRNAADRPEILLRRDEIRVVIQKLMRYKELDMIHKDRLEPELTNVINGAFNRIVFNKLEIKDMQIEKVQKP